MFEGFKNWLYITNIYLCWEFALPSSTLLSVSEHFNANQGGGEGIFSPSLGFYLITQKE